MTELEILKNPYGASYEGDEVKYYYTKEQYEDIEKALERLALLESLPLSEVDNKAYIICSLIELDILKDFVKEHFELFKNENGYFLKSLFDTKKLGKDDYDFWKGIIK